jgi:alkylation response protein AidB-like acyl-CoA dehydrogenase
MDEASLVRQRLEVLLRDHTDAAPVEFFGAQYDLGLAFVHFPEGSGGLGVSPALQRLVTETIVDAGLPVVGLSIGHGMAAPTIVVHASEELKARLLRPLFTGEEVWCQLFSEPGAGSDVASLATTAVRDGDEWVVNGQKVWTSIAHHARWGLLVARTDPDAEKHKGLTYFVIDMKQQGVDVRPLRQMSGQAEFNEVFFTDARVPDSHRLGDVGKGWHVVLTTLMNERVSIGGGVPPRDSGTIRWALDAWRSRRTGAIDGAAAAAERARRDRLVDLWVRAEVLRLTNARAASLRSVGTPGPEGSVGKLASAELNQRILSFCIDLLGPDGALMHESYEMDRSRTSQFATAQGAFLRSRANTIEGGTSEVMRNILAERVLGLPGDVRVDKGVAWKDVPR